MQRVMPDPKLEQQHGQRMQIGVCRRSCPRVAAHQFGSHVFHRARHESFRGIVHTDVVVVADQHVAADRVEHQIPLRHVAVAEAVQVQRAETVGDLIGNLTECRQVRRGSSPRPDITQFGEPLRVDQRHQVAEQRRVRRRNESLGPHEAMAHLLRWPVLDQFQNGRALRRIRVERVVPLDDVRPVRRVGQKHRPLPSFTQLLLDREFPVQRRRQQLLTNDQ